MNRGWEHWDKTNHTHTRTHTHTHKYVNIMILDCQFDGGDCLQLCNFTECNIKTMGDGNCDSGCNNTNCDWDGGDCTEGFGNRTVCGDSCEVAWVGDGW